MGKRGRPKKLISNVNNVTIASPPRMTDGRVARANAYQYVFCERAVTGEYLQSFAADDPPIEIPRELERLEERLKKAFWTAALSFLTVKQRAVTELYLSGMTQTEIARKLKIYQTTVVKTLQGHTSYTSGSPVRYGGIGRKIARMIKSSRAVRQRWLAVHRYIVDHDTPPTRYYTIIGNLAGDAFLTWELHRWDPVD